MGCERELARAELYIDEGCRCSHDSECEGDYGVNGTDAGVFQTLWEGGRSVISHSHGGRDRTFVLGPCLDRLVRDSYGDSIESREIDRT